MVVILLVISGFIVSASADFRAMLDTQSNLTLTSTFNKPIIIKAIKLNKGHCTFRNWTLTFVKGGLFGANKRKYVPRLPVTLQYGESFNLTSFKPGTEVPEKVLWAEICPVIRIDIVTNIGTITKFW